MTKRARRWLPVVAMLILLLLAWMAGLFSDKIAPDLAEPATRASGDAVAAEQVERALFEAVPAH